MERSAWIHQNGRLHSETSMGFHPKHSEDKAQSVSVQELRPSWLQRATRRNMNVFSQEADLNTVWN